MHGVKFPIPQTRHFLQVFTQESGDLGKFRGYCVFAKDLHLAGKYSLYGPIFVLDKGRLGLLVCRNWSGRGVLCFKAACCNRKLEVVLIAVE